MRARYLVLSLGLVMALGSVGISGAGDDIPSVPNPNWFNDPVEGPSPNPDHVVGNEPGGECRGEAINGGIAILAGISLDPGEVFVGLLPKEGAGLEASEIYETDGDGNWGEGRGDGMGVFPIPEDLEPGTYPLLASCHPRGTFTSSAQGVATLQQPPPTFFEYDARSYIVIGERGPADPVEAEVRLTG